MQKVIRDLRPAVCCPQVLPDEDMGAALLAHHAVLADHAVLAQVAHHAQHAEVQTAAAELMASAAKTALPDVTLFLGPQDV